MIKIYRFANRFKKWDFDKIDNRLKKYKLCLRYNNWLEKVESL